RVFDHDMASVWTMLTDSANLVNWLAPGTIELELGGVAKLDFGDSGIVIDSKVSAYSEGRLIEYSWSSPGEPTRPLRFELTADGAQTNLTLTLTVPSDEVVARSVAGFEAHLMMLLAAIEGVPIKFPFERFQETRKSYDEMILS
ncbi:MAG: SRPBCC domain-containing protein, partial [Pseudomonadales bacterium]|nr:SRPBCC domain-containing protein [Pseudomonadales bacterium]